MERCPSRAELRKLKVVELRQRLSAASLPQGGKCILDDHVEHMELAFCKDTIKISFNLDVGIKETLITRLFQYYEKQVRPFAGSMQVCIN